MKLIYGFFEKFFNVRRDEFMLVQAFFAYYTCIGMLYTFGPTVADSLFLSNVPQERIDQLLAWIYVGIAVATVLTTWIYDLVADRFHRIALLVGMQLVLAAVLFVFRILLPETGGSQWLYFCLVIWMEVCGLLSISLFFSFAGDYFTSRDAKRLYAFICGGTAVGTIVAGLLTDPIVSAIGTKNLIYICMAMLGCGAALSVFIYKVGNPVAGEEEEEDDSRTPISAILSHRFILLTFFVVILGYMCFVLVDYQMKMVAQETYRSAADPSEAIAGFFGKFYSYVGAAQMFFQFVMVGWLLNRLGIVNCLMILPFIHLLTSGLFFLTGYGIFASRALLVIAYANFMWMTISETLELPSRQLLLLPLPERLRVRAQAILSGMLVPVGFGMGGLLTIGLAAMHLEIHQISLVVIGLAVLCLPVLYLLKPQYRNTLATSLINNQLDPAEFREFLDSPGADFVLEELLRSEDEEVVMFTMELIEGRPLGSLSPRIRELARPRPPSITARAQTLLGDEAVEEHLDAVELGLHSSSDLIREGAIIAYCQIKKEEALERVKDWIRSTNDATRTAALIGCGMSCGNKGMDLAVPVIESMIEEGDVEMCSAAAQLVGRMQNAGYSFLVERLLEHPDELVQIAAVEAGGEIGSVDLIPRMLVLYQSAALREHVHDALEKMPPECVPMILGFVNNPQHAQESRARLVDVLATIGSDEAQEALWNMFAPEMPLIMRKAAGGSLQSLADSERLVPIDAEEWARREQSSSAKIDLLNRSRNEIGNKDDFSASSLFEQARMEIGCLFHLLSLQFDPEKINRISHNLFSTHSVLRANAIELLDDLLPLKLAPIIKLLEPLVEQQAEQGTGLSVETANEMACDAWPKVLAAYHLHGSGSTAAEQLTAGEKHIYELIEIVAALKDVSIFKEVPGNYMLALAMVTQKLEVPRGHTLFKEGDTGDALYLVVNGEISVQVSGSEVARLKEGECLGEMALVDGLPRSATCVASEESELLVVSDQDFLSFLHGHGSIALGVLQTLTQRLRHQLEATH